MRIQALFILCSFILCLNLATAEEVDVRIATWNANLAERYEIPSMVSRRGNDFVALRRDLDQDVLLLQEVVTREQVELLSRELDLPYFLISDFDEFRGSPFEALEVAILSRYELKNGREFDPIKDGNSESPELKQTILGDSLVSGVEKVATFRGFLTAEIPSLKTAVAVVHLKSSGGKTTMEEDGGNAKQREYVASYVASWAGDYIKRHQDSTVVVGGDFNVGELDLSKVGVDPTEDHGNAREGDLYDDTHALLTSGLVGNLEMTSLSRFIDRSYDSTRFGNTGPIDSLYVAGARSNYFGSAARSSLTYGSDHYPVFASGALEIPDTVMPRDSLTGTLWVQTSAEYASLNRQAYRMASEWLPKLEAEQPWSADLVQRKKGKFQKLPAAVILDIDETVLDNSPFEARRIQDNTTAFSPRWSEWVQEANADLVPGAKDFILRARKMGISVFLISNRHASDEEATIKNLRSHGLKFDPNHILLYDEQPSWGKDKLTRRAEVASDHRILMLIGDDLNDFQPMKGLAPKARKDRMNTNASRDLLGKGWILLPNPTYGSWKDKVPSGTKGLDPKR